MRVVHFCSGSMSKGAARGTLILHLSLLEQGVDSILISTDPVASQTYSAEAVVLATSKFHLFFLKAVNRVIQFLLRIFYRRKTASELISYGFTGLNIAKLAQQMKADVIHLHWINHEFFDISTLSKFKGKIFWTVRDLWPLTGGCHYPGIDCERWTQSCGECPVLGSNYHHDLTAYLHKRKSKVFSETKITFVGISQWVEMQLKRRIGSDQGRSTYVYNSAKIGTAQPNSIIQDFANGRAVLCIGAVNLSLKYKGIFQLAPYLNNLDQESYCLVCFGKGGSQLSHLTALDVLDLGVVGDPDTLASIYAAADVFLMPSLQEAFGKTVVEAQMCGTPVVCFKATGCAELICEGASGITVPLGDFSEMVAQIPNAVQLKSESIANHPHLLAFNPEQASRAYQILYRSGGLS